MANFLDTLLRDSPGEERFTPAQAPTFVPATARRGVQALERTTAVRNVLELAQPVQLTPFAGVDFLTALIFRSRPDRDPDRFTFGLGLAAPTTGDSGDPYPILF